MEEEGEGYGGGRGMGYRGERGWVIDMEGALSVTR